MFRDGCVVTRRIPNTSWASATALASGAFGVAWENKIAPSRPGPLPEVANNRIASTTEPSVGRAQMLVRARTSLKTIAQTVKRTRYGLFFAFVSTDKMPLIVPPAAAALYPT
jgi:hypothetical protein